MSSGGMYSSPCILDINDAQRALAMSSDCCSVLGLVSWVTLLQEVSYIPTIGFCQAVQVEKKIGGSDFTICHCFFVCIYIPFANHEHLIEPLESARVTLLYVAANIHVAQGLSIFVINDMSIPVPSLVILIQNHQRNVGMQGCIIN